MDEEKYARAVALLCPTCGNSELEIRDKDTDAESVRCPSCDRVMSREELIREHRELIDANVEEMKAEVLTDTEKEFRAMFKRIFK